MFPDVNDTSWYAFFNPLTWSALMFKERPDFTTISSIPITKSTTAENPSISPDINPPTNGICFISPETPDVRFRTLFPESSDIAAKAFPPFAAISPTKSPSFPNWVNINFVPFTHDSGLNKLLIDSLNIVLIPAQATLKVPTKPNNLRINQLCLEFSADNSLAFATIAL